MKKQTFVGGCGAALLAFGSAQIAGCSGCGQPQLESMLDVTFNRPTSGQQLSPLDKSDPTASGFPVDVEVLGVDSAGRTIALQDAKLELRSSGAADWSPGPAAQLDGAKAVFPATPLASGSNMLRATITEKDSLRTATRTIAAVVPNATGCGLSFTVPPSSPFVFNMSFDEDPSTPGLQTTIRGVTTKCMGYPVSLYKGADAGTLLGTTTADVGSGAFSVPITLQDFEQARLTVMMADPFPPNPMSSAFADVSVKISPPQITNASPAIGSPFSSLYYVADSNIYLLQPDAGQPGAGYIKNKGPDGDAIADFGFTVSNASGGVAHLTYRGADLGTPVPITSDPQNVSWSNAVLTQKSSGVLQYVVTDGVGNQTVRSANTVVDVIPPAPSSLTTVTLPTDGGARTATVNLSWTASGDDGMSGGNPAGYDLRWSTKVVLPNGIATDGGYFDPSQFAASPNGVASGSATAAQVGPLPPLNTYYFQIRPFDSVGNYARQSPQAMLDNFLKSTSALNPDAGTTTDFGLHLAAADFDGDGKDDLAVGAPTTDPGTVYVYKGTADLSTFGAAPWKILTPADGQNGFFGLDFSTGHVTDDPAKHADLIVSQNVWSSCGAQASRGRAFLYLRALGSDPSCTPSSRCIFEFRGTAGSSATSFSASARIIPDINGDGYDEVLISAHREDNQVGRVYLFFGRSRSAWQAIATATDVGCPPADGAGYIPTSAADRVFFGDRPPGQMNYFGRLRGYTTIDNRAADAGVLFTIPASLESVHKLYLLPGNTDGGQIDAGIVAQTLNYGPDALPNSGTGFGAEACGTFNLIDGPAKDLVVTQPKFNNVFLFPDCSASGFTSSPTIINSPFGGNFGAALAVGDINGDGRPDLLVGENAAAQQSAWIFYNKPIINQEFDLAAGNLLPGSGFAQSRLTPAGSQALGLGLAVGDFNGDGKMDIAAGDPANGVGKVTVWY